ncbi:unnamed protein product [Chondrus crispus]|uniref:Uncharacterized protein n=1 Tax=Chondrus crispus TaxID=2769 RepID=R7Q7K5_CHOCR|nr:unnamed protein product [Chondrus crispus]CDF34502.1 unnamed protein product [Chondrus crispus]|eukprot:XP_005714321.1 unnamed protein product [Chondrus crispus]
MLASSIAASAAPSASATAAAATVAHKQALLAAHRPASMNSTTSAPKRGRSSAGISTKEPDPKRVKQSPSPFVGAPARPGANKPPGSPTTSSRSRQRKSNKPRGSVAAFGEEASGVPNMRSASRPRPNSRAQAAPLQVSCFSVEGTSVTSIIPPPPLSKRLFGHEIQCLMHAFGEVRFCARDVLELTEDSVRDAVIRTAIAAHQFATEETPAGEEIVVSLRHVVRCMYSDYRAIVRLQQALKPDLPKLNISAMDFERLSNVPPPQWDRFSELGFLGSLVHTPDKASNFPPRADVQTLCAGRSFHIYRLVMGPPNFQDWLMCRSVSLVRQESKSRAPAIRGQPRIDLFREWIGVEQNLNFSISEDGLIALGHVAWEAIGLITQTALLHRYDSIAAKGARDPRARYWSFASNLVEALNFGIGAGIIIPLSEIQMLSVRSALDTRIVSLQNSSNKWRGYAGDVYPGLVPRDIREALRRLGRSSGSRLGLRGKSFLQTLNIL